MLTKVTHYMAYSVWVADNSFMILSVPINLFLFAFLEWSNQDVVERYLKPINMEHMAKAFLENNINGAVLLALEVKEIWVCYTVQILQDLNPLSSMYSVL